MVPTPSSTVLAATSTAPSLPPELHQEILSTLFKPCTSRRDVTANLLVSQHKPESGQYDRIVRAQGLPGTDDFEIVEYRTFRNIVSTLSLVSQEFQRHALAIKRKWLERRPMDLATFSAFCNDPTAAAFSALTEIVLELFPSAAFIGPPPFINHGKLDVSPTFIDAKARDILRRRFRLRHSAQLRCAYGHLHPAHELLDQLDQEIMFQLAAMWSANFARLPKSVRRVTTIVKLPELSQTVGLDSSKQLLWLFVLRFKMALKGILVDTDPNQVCQRERGREGLVWEFER